MPKYKYFGIFACKRKNYCIVDSFLRNYLAIPRESSVIFRMQRLFNHFHMLHFTELLRNSPGKFRNILHAKAIQSLLCASFYGTILQFPGKVPYYPACKGYSIASMRFILRNYFAIPRESSVISHMQSISKLFIARLQENWAIR